VYEYDYWIYPNNPMKHTKLSFHDQYHYLNVDIVKYFESISHKEIYFKTPITNKYKYLLKVWTQTAIVGTVNKESKKIVKIIPTAGVSLGSIIGPMLCNLILDGLQNYIESNVLERYERENKIQRYIEYTVKKVSSQIFCIRYVDNILILAKCPKLYMDKIQELLIEFLNKYDLTIKNPEIKQGKLFTPGSSIEYIGFKICFPDLKKDIFDKGKYTKIRFTPRSLVFGNFSKYTRGVIYLIVCEKAFTNIKDKIKKQFNSRNVFLPVNVMINNVNSIVRGFLNYFNLTETISIQIKSLNDLLHRLMYKYLLRKYSSVPKVYSYIRANFIKEKRFCYKNTVLLRVSDVKPVPLWLFSPSNDFLKSNIYIDKAFQVEKCK